MKQGWTTEMECEDEKSEAMTVPSHLKKYTIQDRKIVIKQPIKTSQIPGESYESYDGPENAKKIDLADEGQEPRPAYIAMDLEPKEEKILIKTL